MGCAHRIRGGQGSDGARGPSGRQVHRINLRRSQKVQSELSSAGRNARGGRPLYLFFSLTDCSCEQGLAIARQQRGAIMRLSAEVAAPNSVVLVMDPIVGEIPHSMSGGLVAATPSCMAVG